MSRYRRLPIGPTCFFTVAAFRRRPMFCDHALRIALHDAIHHFNPVKHGYVKKVSEWPHSTFHRRVRDGVYPVDWGGTLGISDLNLE